MPCPACHSKLLKVLYGYVTFTRGEIERFGDKLREEVVNEEITMRWYRCPHCNMPLNRSDVEKGLDD